MEMHHLRSNKINCFQVKKDGKALGVQLHELGATVGAVVLFFGSKGAASGALAAVFGGRFIFRHFARFVRAEEGSDHLALAVAVEVVHAQPRGGHEHGGSQQVNDDMSE